jgi:hypothetical protein
MFINDLANIKIKSKLVLFADDTTVYISCRNIIKAKSALADLTQIAKWLTHNRLVLNLAKTNAMHFPFSRSDLELSKNLERERTGKEMRERKNRICSVH